MATRNLYTRTEVLEVANMTRGETTAIRVLSMMENRGIDYIPASMLEQPEREVLDHFLDKR